MRSLFFVLMCLAATCIAAQAAGENIVTLNVEPTKEHPRNSEGSFATLKSGRILFYYSQFYGGGADDSPARLVEIHSDDKGRTWSEPKTVVENGAGNNVMSVSLLRLKSGKLALIHIVKNSWLDCRPYMRTSTDEGVTWSEPKALFDAPGYFVLNNDRVVQTSTGRLIAPVAFHRSRTANPKGGSSFDARGIAMWYLSDDEGATWHEASTWWAAPKANGSGMQEPGVVELSQGHLMSWTRTAMGSQYAMHSTDDGKSWSPPVPTELMSPTSPASIRKLPGTEDLLVLFNDHSGKYPLPKNKNTRTPFVAAISSDGGKTWPVRKLLEDDPTGCYCYTAVHFVDDAVLLGYCAGDAKVGGLNRLRIRRITLDWLK